MEQRYRLAQELAREATTHLKQNFNTGAKKVAAPEKERLNLVTQADVALNNIILDGIRAQYPNDTILSEEDNPVEGSNQFFWSVDPVDGTFNFSRGISHFAVAIGGLLENEPVFGVIHAPDLQIEAHATPDEGCRVNDQPVKCSQRDVLEESLLVCEFGYKDRQLKLLKSMYPLIQEVAYIEVVACSAIGLLYLAQGKIDGFIHLQVDNIWDILPGAMLVQAAGGKVTDLNGEPLRWIEDTALDVVASNGYIHNKLLEKLNQPKV